MKKSIFIKAILITLMLSLLSINLFAYSRHVNLVKDGAFEVFPDVSVEDFFSTVFNDIGTGKAL